MLTLVPPCFLSLSGHVPPQERDMRSNTLTLALSITLSQMQAVVHQKAFDLAHQLFFHKTVHAGEGFGPESIGQVGQNQA